MSCIPPATIDSNRMWWQQSATINSIGTHTFDDEAAEKSVSGTVKS